ncbi:MAG: hypothetical protein GC162_05920 [Planctomycetes bacterium]|nr:hypothetical protein [Planctomycetota bacterium]
MKRHTRIATLAAVLFAGVAPHVRAAIVTWQTPQEIVAGSDVSTLGTQVFGRDVGLAYNNPSAVVNSVNLGFNNPAWTVTFSESGGGGNTGNISAPVMGGPDGANYRAVLGTQARAWSNVMTFTFGNLSVGQDYLIQLWVGDWRAFTNNRAETIAAGGLNTNVNTPTLKFLDSDLSNTPSPSHGQWVIGKWTADASSISFTLTATSDTIAQYNAMQLRLIPAPAALPAGLGLLSLLAMRRRR